MKVGIFTGDHTKYETGIGNYILNLINELKNRCELSIIRHPKGYDYSIKNQIIPNTLASAGMMIWSCAVSGQKYLFSDLDLVHSPTLALFPVKPHENYVLTVHDIIFKKFPQFLPKGTIRHTKLFFRRNLISADKIIAVSQSTKNDIIKHYKIDEKKIIVIPEAADPIFRPLTDNEIEKIKQKYSLNTPFILYVGTIEPRKNITIILDAFALSLKSFPNLELVIAGKKGWYYEQIFLHLQKLGIQEKVRFLGYVPLSDLPALYNAAHIFVYPSYYEGFGLPPLEAMQCGTPVITSDVSSLPEVMGNKGIMVSPNNAVKLGKEIKKLIPDSAYRNNQIQFGIEQARKFSWKKTADLTIEIYESVLDNS